MLVIDGAQGEGGGQIVRSALALSLCYQQPVTINHIRSKRRQQGLGWQHLAALTAAAKIGNAIVTGATRGSRTLTFTPRGIHSGEFHFDIGTAGSTILVLQTILPALLQAEGPSSVTLTGGTHNPLAPSFDYLNRVFLPILARMGAEIDANLIQPGFAPRGEGQLQVLIHPVKHLLPLHIDNRGKILELSATTWLAGLPLHIAERELGTLQKLLDIPQQALTIEPLSSAYGPGNVVFVEIRSEALTELFCAYGAKHLRAETLAQRLAREVKEYIRAGVPVGQHLADQLLLPMALAGAGSFVSQPLSSHSLTNMAVISQFTGSKFQVETRSDKQCAVSL